MKAYLICTVFKSLQDSSKEEIIQTSLGKEFQSKGGGGGHHSKGPLVGFHKSSFSHWWDLEKALISKIIMLLQKYVWGDGPSNNLGQDRRGFYSWHLKLDSENNCMLPVLHVMCI